MPNRGNAGGPYTNGDITRVLLPVISSCLKTGENGGLGTLHLVGLNTDVKTPIQPHSIHSTHPSHSLPDLPYEKPNGIHLPDDYRAS